MSRTPIPDRACRAELLERRAMLTLTPAGGELPVNGFPIGDQFAPAIASDADGDFVVVWQSNGQDGDDGGIYAQRYTRAGVPQGTEFRVNNHTLNSQSFPAVAMVDDGDFVVAWQSNYQDGSNYGIFARRYNDAGIPQDFDFQVNLYTTDQQIRPT